MNIKLYRAEDRQQLQDCVIALQDYERTIDSRMPDGESIAVDYMADMFDQCEKYDGRIFLAEQETQICGYITIHTRYVSDEIEDGPREFGYIGDLFVKETFRGQGIGHQLMRKAEDHARRNGAKEIMIGVLAENTVALKLYQKQGFNTYAVTLEKKL